MFICECFFCLVGFFFLQKHKIMEVVAFLNISIDLNIHNCRKLYGLVINWVGQRIIKNRNRDSKS